MDEHNDAGRSDYSEVVAKAVDEWYSSAWYRGARTSAVERSRLTWIITRRLGLNNAHPGGES